MENQDIIIRSFDQIEQLNHLSTDDKDAWGSSDFSYYTSISTADSILQNQYFWVSPLSRMNDINEAELHKDRKDCVFALCFCQSSSEKIPMWYLYSGITGKGTRLSMTTSKMRDFIDSIVEVYPIRNNTVMHNKPYIKGKDFEMAYGWVYYWKSDEKKVKYRNKFYEIEDFSEESVRKSCYFIKDYPWEYEKEFRITFSFPSFSPPERIAVRINDSIYDNLKIAVAPEIEVDENLLNYKGISDFLLRSIKKSSLKIKMALVGRNIDAIVDELVLNHQNRENLIGKLLNDIEKKTGKSIESFKEE